MGGISQQEKRSHQTSSDKAALDSSQISNHTQDPLLTFKVTIEHEYLAEMLNSQATPTTPGLTIRARETFSK